MNQKDEAMTIQDTFGLRHFSATHRGVSKCRTCVAHVSQTPYRLNDYLNCDTLRYTCDTYATLCFFQCVATQKPEDQPIIYKYIPCDTCDTLKVRMGIKIKYRGLRGKSGVKRGKKNFSRNYCFQCVASVA